MKILKELIFSRVKAYNMVQVFHFLSEHLRVITVESYSAYLTTDWIPTSLFGFKVYMLIRLQKKVLLKPKIKRLHSQK